MNKQEIKNKNIIKDEIIQFTGKKAIKFEDCKYRKIVSYDPCN